MDYGTAWKKRIKEDEEKRLGLFREAGDAAARAARILVDEFDAKRVYLFGSLLTSEDFTERSDIDLAVEGLRDELYFKALNRVWDVLPEGMELDLVPIEDADEYVKAKIFSTGAILYERELACP